MTLSNAVKALAVCAIAAGVTCSFGQTLQETRSAFATHAHKIVPVQVSGAWVRATVPGQQGSGAFMSLTSKVATRLVGVSTPVAGIAEVHEMKMQGDIMKMQPVPALDLPAGKTVELKSGGYHLMLMDLKQPLNAGSSVPMTLRFKDARGIESRLDISVAVSLLPPVAGTESKAAPAEPSGHGMHKH